MMAAIANAILAERPVSPMACGRREKICGHRLFFLQIVIIISNVIYKGLIGQLQDSMGSLIDEITVM